MWGEFGVFISDSANILSMLGICTEQWCFQWKEINLDVKLFTERSTEKRLPLRVCLSGTFVVKT